MIEVKPNPTFQAIQTITVDVTGSEPEEITPNLFLEEISMEEFPKIIVRVNQKYGLTLSAKEILSECETLDDLVMLVEDEQEWG